MKRKATDELIADRPPPMLAMRSKVSTTATTTTATMTPAISAIADTSIQLKETESLHDANTIQLKETESIHDANTDTPTTARSALSPPSAPSVSAVTATTAASRRFPSDLKTIRCTWPDCDKTFNRPARLTAHMRSHTNDRPFQCPECPKTYLEEKHLRQHVKGSHTEERQYVCDACSKAFLTATRLRRHAAVHEGQDRFRCKGYDDACTRTFRKHQTLQRHIRVDHLQQPAFYCTNRTGASTNTCGAMFDSAGALRRHVEREHAAPKFWCDACASADPAPPADVGFATKQLLESHMRHAHANCPFCDARCAGPAELHKHVDMYHAGKTVADRKTISCPHAGCTKKFTRRPNLNVHIRAAHEGLRYVCGGASTETADGEADEGPATTANPAIAAWFLQNDGCGRGFVSKMKLEEHVLYVHLGHERPAPLKTANPELSVVADDDDENDNLGLEDDMIDALLGTNRTLACTARGCTARFVRHHDLNTHMQRDHVADGVDGVDGVNDINGTFHADTFWTGGGSGVGPTGDDIFGAFIDMNADMLPDMGLNMDEVQWQMDEAEMRQLIGSESVEAAGGGNGNGHDNAFLDPNLFQ